LAVTQAQISTWDCEDSILSTPIQYLLCGTTGTNRPLCSDPDIVLGHGFYALDLGTGLYQPLFTILATEISAMNACGINPTDNFAYCAVRIDGSLNTQSKARLIRFGSSHTNPNDADYEIVAILPVPTDVNPTGGKDANAILVNTAAFSGAGNYYVSAPPAHEHPPPPLSISLSRSLSRARDCAALSMRINRVQVFRFCPPPESPLRNYVTTQCITRNCR
jgi:hypothetical protein